MKEFIFWGWISGLGLIMAGLLTYLVLDIRFDSTGEEPSPAGCFITVAGVVVVIIMLCMPGSYEPL